MREHRNTEEFERAIADLRQRWPAHSVPPAMVELLEELEEGLALARARLVGDNA